MDRRDLFFFLCRENYERLGFRYIKSKNSFKKKNEETEYIIRFTTWPDFAQVSVSYSLIINKVEKVKKKAWGKLYNKFETCGINKEYLDKETDDFVHFTDTTENIHTAVEKESKFYYSNLLRYFDNHSSMEFINSKYNNKLYEDIPDIAHFNRLHSAAVSILAAKEENNPLLDEIANHYAEIIKRVQPSYSQEINLFIDLIYSDE